MNPPRPRRRTIGVTLATAAVLGAAGIAAAANPFAAAASPGGTQGGAAAASGVCQQQVWSDSVTYGAACQEDYAYKYQAKAVCKNGQVVNGSVVTAPNWSYAYCSQVGSTLDHGVISFRVP